MVLKPAEGFSVEPQSVTGNQDSGYSDTNASRSKTGGGKNRVGGPGESKAVWAKPVCGPDSVWTREAWPSQCADQGGLGQASVQTREVWAKTMNIWTRVM